MNRHIVKFFLGICFSIFGFVARGLEMDVHHYTFFAEKSYAEVHLRIVNQSVSKVITDDQTTAGVECILIVYDKDSLAVFVDKFVLQGNLDAQNPKDLLTVKRFYIESGTYRIHLQAVDINDQTNSLELEQKMWVSGEGKSTPGLSDPVLLSRKMLTPPDTDQRLSRHGFAIEPLPFSYADTGQHVVYFMQEVYIPDPDANQTYFLNYTISEQYKDNLNAKVLISQYKKLENLSFQFVMIPLSLKELVSGEYHLSTYLLNKEKVKFSEKKANFFKSNPKADIIKLEMESDDSATFSASIPEDELDYVLKAHVPVTSTIQLPTLQEIIKSTSVNRKRKFIGQFWLKKSPGSPEDSYKKYMEVARAVDKEYYSNVGYGFQTHRGYIFLKHGKPNSVLSIDNEPDAPPYEIWYYNKILSTNQTNVRFLFWNESLAHNDFWLLHSTCYGERNNPAWEAQLYRSVPNDKLDNTVDGTQVKAGWNRQARTYFNQF